MKKISILISFILISGCSEVVGDTTIFNIDLQRKCKAEIHSKLQDPRKINYEVSSTKFTKDANNFTVLKFDLQMINSKGVTYNLKARCKFDRTKLIEATYL